MEPISTLAIAAAALVAKGAEHYGPQLWDKFSSGLVDRAGGAAEEQTWSVLGRLATRVRGWFSDHDDPTGTAAVELVAAAPDSPSSVERLAGALAVALEQDPGLRRAVEQDVEAARAATGPVGAFSVQVWGDARVGKIQQIHTVNADTFNA